MQYFWPVILTANLMAVIRAGDYPSPKIATASSDPATQYSSASAGNPQSAAKIALGDKLIHDKRFSVNGKVNDFLSGGLCPLNLTDAQIDDLVAFLDALTSAQYAKSTAVAAQ